MNTTTRVTDAMVSRFLAWPLPKDFAPDCYVEFKHIAGSSWPVGTNLFTAAQARAMLEYVLSGSAPQAVIELTPAEIQSGLDRVRWAEGLIRQLPEDHDGRNSWLLNFGSDAAERQAAWAERNPNSALVRTIETKTYPDGTTATGPAPLPEKSPIDLGEVTGCKLAPSLIGKNAPDLRPTAPVEAATLGETKAEQQTSHLCEAPPEWVELRASAFIPGAGSVRIKDIKEEWIRYKVESAHDWQRNGRLFVRDGYAMRAVTLGNDCRQASPPPPTLADVVSAAAPKSIADMLTQPCGGKNAAELAPKVTSLHVEAAIASEHYFTAEDGVLGSLDAQRGLNTFIDAITPESLRQLTFCVLLLKNGHKVVGINYGSVDPAQHDADVGRADAREDAIRQVWPLLGYALRERLAGGGL